MAEVVGLTQQDFDRLRRMIKWFEGRPPDRAHVAGGEVPNWQHVRITGPAIGDGSGSGSGSGSDDGLRYWPAVVEVWDAFTDEPIILANVWVLDRNDFDLEVQQIYVARESGRKQVEGDTRDLFIHGQGLSYPRFDDDGSGSAIGSGGDCTSTTGNSHTLRLPVGCDSLGNPEYQCVTVTSPVPLRVSVCGDNCGEGSGS